ncbi:GAK system ATP-grasp enzyme [Halodesulfovibrio sp. MK-HDV]|jgi:ATP-grasp enzyme of GAK system|uniref:GAK system ATP-grasp enzyme n=1 Tax=Halodesulfovibrio sp. MK-HDV TaxID=2599925 RepID=UPI00136D937F|nr:GAK system ATP-grasp enzyme [Halodesulfovibrio sp. MK-HDV]KAF1077173.1 Alpha-aminoadipate--LysW ligase LysX [Halodesulfovibrio sp. MK-HDV]
MKIGVVGTPDGWSSEFLADTVAEKTGYRLLIDMKDVRLDLHNNTCWFEGIDLNTLDALIIKKVGAWYSPALLDRLEMLRFLNEQGLSIFSKPASMISVLNRLSCTTSLKLAGIPMPPTTLTESIEEALYAVAEYGTAVFKPLYSSKGRGMIIVSDSDDVRTIVTDYAAKFSMMYIQKVVDLEEDKDLGVVFIQGKYLTTYARCKGDSWNTTTASGGHYASFTPSLEIIELARKAQHPFKLDFTCVDVAITPDGPVVFEVSAFGGFKGVLKARGINAAQLYVDAVIKEIS